MTNIHESVCNATLRNLDAFLDKELNEGTALAVQQHVDACIDCSRELKLRSNLRDRVRSIAAGDSASPFLRTRVLANLRQHERRSSGWFQQSAWAPAAAAILMITIGASVAYQLGHLRFTVAAQNGYVETMLQKVSFGMRPGLSDHIHCAVFRKYPKHAPAIETLRTDLGQEYKPVLDMVESKMPSGFELHMAHQCTFRGRKFVHVVLRSGSNLVSLVLTRRRPGETLGDNQIAPVISREGLNLFAASAQRFRMSGFETQKHFAYLVTDLSPAETQRLMLAMGPELRAFLSGLPA